MEKAGYSLPVGSNPLSKNIPLFSIFNLNIAYRATDVKLKINKMKIWTYGLTISPYGGNLSQ